MPQLPFIFRAEKQLGAEPPSEEMARPLTVSELTAELRRCLENQVARVWVEGELRSVQLNRRSGHAYFELADARSSVSVFMSSLMVRKLSFELHDGLHVLLEGQASVYEPRGRLQLRARRLEPVGEGALLLALRSRIQKLRMEGLTDDARKRAIPKYPRPIGVVTSRSGAALRDVLRTAVRRDPGVHILFAHAAVQGVGAVSEIVRALRRLEDSGCAVILLVRGGGSLKDLQAFNEEPVALAVARCRIPVVTGVGHESDTTLVDLVADARASTPTAAAEVVVPDRSELERRLALFHRRLGRAFAGRLTRAERDLRKTQACLRSPTDQIHRLSQSLDELEARAEAALRRALKSELRQLQALELRLGDRKPEARISARRARLERLRSRLGPAAERHIARRAAELGRREAALDPAVLRKLEVVSRNFERTVARLTPVAAAETSKARARFERSVARLEALSPFAVLSRGYAVVTAASGRAVRKAAELSPGERIRVRLYEGTFEAEVSASDSPNKS